MLARTLVCALLFTLSGARTGFAQSDAIAPDEIAGTLTFFGCSPSASDFTLYAVPLSLETDGRRVEEPPLDLPVLDGELIPTRRPRVFRVSVPDVEAGVPYQLRIQDAPPNPCGRVFWEGPEQGVVFAGVPVRLRGYAPQSSIEVRAASTPEAPRRGWVGAETIDVQNLAAATRQLRWRTDVPGVDRGRIQVSTREFPKRRVAGRSCATAPGIVFEAEFAATSGDWNMLPPLNFAGIAANVFLSGPNGLERYGHFTHGAPLYVRVIPLSRGTPLCNPRRFGPAPWVVLANAAKDGGTRIFFGVDPPGPPPPAPIELSEASGYTPPWFWSHPQGGSTAYRVVHEHKIPEDIFSNFPASYLKDPWAFQFAKFTDLGPGDTIPVGYRFWFKPGSSFGVGDVFEGAVSIVTGVVDAVGLVVSEISKAYEAIKKAVAKVVTSAISATGLVDCEQSAACRELVETAIESGLAATGLPPSLPNFDDIVDEGFEYFAAEVVSQAGASTIPGAQELTEAAAKKVVQEAVQKMKDGRGGGGALPKWLSLDLGQEPAVLILELTTWGPTDLPLFPNHLRLSGNDAFLEASLPIPSKWRETNTLDKYMRIPVVLRPNLQGFVPPKGPFGEDLGSYLVGTAAKTWWKARLASIACVGVDNRPMIKIGPFLVASTYELPSLAFDPEVATGFPPYAQCVP